MLDLENLELPVAADLEELWRGIQSNLDASRPVYFRGTFPKSSFLEGSDAASVWRASVSQKADGFGAVAWEDVDAGAGAHHIGTGSDAGDGFVAL